MSIALVTRGIICHTSSSATSLLTWGFLCPSTTSVEVVIGFGAKESPPTCTFIYSLPRPQVNDPGSISLFPAPSSQLTGRKNPTLGVGRPSLASPASPNLHSTKVTQLTGSKITTLVGDRHLLLSEPEEPTLNSSNTRAPDIFDKDC